MIFKVNFPFEYEVKLLFKILCNNGDELRLVGGCVRDYLCKAKIKDIDLCTSLSPIQVISLLEKNSIKVIKHYVNYGTIIAIINNKRFEITSLRIDVKTYGRKADVKFITDYHLDAKRRDFTINAMSIDKNNYCYDYFNGARDIKNGNIRFIGEAEKRISEDYLRILRFFRFYSIYGKYINKSTLKKIIPFVNKLDTISSEKIRKELFIIFSSNSDKILEIVEIFNNYLFLSKLIKWDYCNINLLKNYLLIEKEINLKKDYRMRIYSLFLNIPIDNFVKSFKLEKKEIKFIKKISLLRNKIDLDTSSKKINNLLITYSKEDMLLAFIFKYLKEIRTFSYIKTKVLDIKQILHSRMETLSY